MPVERSKSSRRSGADGNQLVWTIPVEPASVEADFTTFAPIVTSVTFDDGPPPLVDAPPSEYILFPPTNDSSITSRRPGHSKKKPEDHIPRPPNAFILFRSSFIKGQHVPTEVETNHSTLSKIIGLTWKNLPNDERQFWHAKAKAALDEHKRKFPQYAFKPAQGKGKGGTEKRKVREVGPKDHKRCAKIAELLVEGKKGQELDEAIQEFDKHHVPEIVTRFEAPLTARMYRRSSSAPILENEEPPRRTSDKYRSSSTQPGSANIPQPSQDPKQEDLPQTPYLSSFDQYSMTQLTPSFDLNTFSFDDRSSPLPPFSCDPLSDSITSHDTNGTLFNVPNYNYLSNDIPSPLSIDTSYLGMDVWTRCSSPMSAASSSMPTTPSYFDSPSPHSYNTFNDSVDSFEQSLAESLGKFDLPRQYEMYPNTCESHQDFSGGYTNAESPSEYPSFDQHHKVHLANQDLDFSAFMIASLPEYSI